MRSITRLRPLAAGLLVMVTVAACKTLDAPDQNANTLQGLTGAPTRASVITATQGLISGLRGAGPCTGGCAYLGREGYNLDPSNPQNVSTNYIVGGDFSAWTTPYSNNKQIDIILTAIAGIPSGQMSDAEKDGIRGFVLTVKAMDLNYVIQTTDQTGAVLEVAVNSTDPPPPLANRAAVYARILQLLDSSYTYVTKAGTTFPFAFSPGFSGFTTPANFAKFNRAIKARVDVYAGNYANALTDLTAALTAPFSGAPATLAQLNVGVYNTYSTISGDAANGVYDATDRQRFAHTGYAIDAQLQAGATPGDTTRRDARFLRKFGPVRNSSGVAIAGGFDRYGFHINWSYRVYNTLSDAIPVIRNEELILLRAEANLACSTTGDGVPVTCTGGAAQRVAALADINLIRQTSGGLAAIATDPGPGGTLTGDLLLDELLYNKRYSMVWEGGYRWFDARKYGILSKLPKDDRNFTPPATQHVVFPYSRLPDSECSARSITVNAAGTPCAVPAGL